MIITRIITSIAGFKKNIWSPFRNWFWGIIGGTAIWEYKGAIDMQEYLPAETVEIRITKLQSFLLWVTDWKIFSWIKFYWKLFSDFFGISKYIILFFIGVIFLIIIYRILNYFYMKYLPNKKQREKYGEEFLKSLVIEENKKIELEKKFRDLEIKLKEQENLIKNDNSKSNLIKLSEQEKQIKTLIDANSKLIEKINLLEKQKNK